MGSIGAASTEFCFDMFKELKVHHVNENIIYSPLSIISILSMVFLGARENTKTQMEKVIHFDKITGFGESLESQCGTSVSVHASLKDILSEITKPSDNYSLSLASKLYAEETYPVLPEYLQCIKELYKGSLETVSFQTAADQARELINSWVETQTNGVIKNFLQPGSVDPQTEMVLVDAIYFKGTWEKAFKDEDTQEVPFRITEQESKPVQMMYQAGSFKVATVAAEKMKILELPYASGELSMFVLLPDDISGLEQLETTISIEKLSEWTSSNMMEDRKMKVYLPHMKIEEKYNLTSVLVALGMTDLFSPSANLSGISTAQTLKMSEAIHGAYVEIYEAGSEMATSTGVLVEAASVSEEFRVDHPFLFLIKHNPSNSILFFGRCIFPHHHHHH
uniref:Ovalbumin n=1 Tax=Dromaius novaehollandiae TaxID=8790 RepID=UPI0002782C19|nr:Chain A, Ovalbumin [Dromaius novaehollandiae]6KGA_B Chain B, Ovalbumin [Dromaius novaehollandiae]6KGA_C Chain C, Ovalbumin [Dromaius novaehollandiae]